MEGIWEALLSRCNLQSGYLSKESDTTIYTADRTVRLQEDLFVFYLVQSDGDKSSLSVSIPYNKIRIKIGIMSVVRREWRESETEECVETARDRYVLSHRRAKIEPPVPGSRTVCGWHASGLGGQALG